MNDRQIRVLIVNESVAVQDILTQMLRSDPGILISRVAGNNVGTLDAIKERAIDVVLVDLESRQDGFDIAMHIMETRPVPIIICSDRMHLEFARARCRSVEVGAVALVQRPALGACQAPSTALGNVIDTIRLMSEVKVVRRWPRSTAHGGVLKMAPPPVVPPSTHPIDVVGIGASTGGPSALKTILSGLPKTFSVPILIVQHIAPGFVADLAHWLYESTGIETHIAVSGVQCTPGHVYLAPDNQHMRFQPDGRIHLSRRPPENGLRPSIGHLFASLADLCGPRAVGVLLTGMGRDGAVGLKTMKDRGASTIVQDRETSVVYGMPGEAVNLGADTHILPPVRIAGMLVTLASPRSN